MQNNHEEKKKESKDYGYPVQLNHNVKQMSKILAFNCCNEPAQLPTPLNYMPGIKLALANCSCTASYYEPMPTDGSGGRHHCLREQ